MKESGSCLKFMYVCNQTHFSPSPHFRRELLNALALVQAASPNHGGVSSAPTSPTSPGAPLKCSAAAPARAEVLLRSF